MAKQLNIEDILTAQANYAAKEFLVSAYKEDAETLPAIRTSFEAYGILAAANQAVTGAVKTLKDDMGDALKTISIGDDAFLNATECVRATLAELARSTVSMYEHAMNISVQMMGRMAPAAPLLDPVNDELPGDDEQ